MVDYLTSRGKGIVRFTRRVLASFSEHNNVKDAAALSYYTLFSLFPLMLFLLYIASQFFPSEESRRLLANYLEEFFPYGADNLTRILDQTWKARGSIGLVSGIGLWWSGSSIFSILETSLSKIWESSPRGFWHRRLLGALSVLSLVVTFLASFFLGPMTDAILENSGEGRWLVGYMLQLATIAHLKAERPGIPLTTVLLPSGPDGATGLCTGKVCRAGLRLSFVAITDRE